MAKYKVGEKFIATITKVDDSGMGTTYTFNDGMITTENVVDFLAPYNADNSPENEPKEDKAKKYTIEELEERILVMSNLMARVISAYQDAKKTIRNAVDAVDDMRKGEVE